MLCFVAFLACQRPQLTSEVSIYSGEKALADQNLTLAKWGGGSIAESDWVVLKGKHSLRLTGNNYFQGGSIGFKNPLDLRNAYADRSKLLRFTFFLESPDIKYGRTMKNVIVKYKMRESYNIGQKTVPVRPTHVTKMRLVVTTTDDRKSEFYLPVIVAKKATVDGWKTAGLPVRAITGFGKSNMEVKEIRFSLDAKGIMYIGDMDIASDPVPIAAEVKPPAATIKAGSRLTFTAFGEAGLTPLKYLWDFDPRDGNQVDAEAQSVRHTFYRPGKYTVTLTVADRFGLKRALVKTVNVQVTR